MMMTRYIFLLFLSLATNHPVESVMVTEVKAGHLAELPCLSNDEHHRFMFWELLNEKDIIGPGNPLNQEKYNYEVLTGKLFIRGVSTAESGFYKCVSRGLSDISAINVESVELVVEKDPIVESEFETNLLRGMTAAMILTVIAAIILILTYKRQRNHRLFELDESRENFPDRFTDEIPNSAETSSPASRNTGFDNAGLDVDFPKIFNQMHKVQAIIP